MTAGESSLGAGLGVEEAARRLGEAGPNEITRGEATSPWKILAVQFASPLIGLLLAASVVSALLGEVADAIAIGAILVINACVGFFQEYRAEKAMLALRSMTAPRARVRRGGRALTISAAEVVPGDALLLEAGDVVAADARLVEAHALTTNEAPLTGESAPVEKASAPARAEAPLAERTDSVFMGTSVATGVATAVVVATGMRTELGRIAHLLQTTAQDDETPLQRRLATVGRTLLYACLVIVAAVGALGLLRGMPWLDVLMSAVSLAVAAVPEGLPAVVTIALAIGVQRMAARHALIRKLPAVETLGSATVICTDKTGTLTTGVMTVRELWGADHLALLEAACACCDAELPADDAPAAPGGARARAPAGAGDPSELAILAAGAERGLSKEAIEKARPRTAVSPFDPVRKRMSILRADGILYVKGALDLLLPLCSSGVEGAAEANADMAARGLRVLAVATGRGVEEKELRLLGIIGIADPPRTEAIEAVAAARQAGIRTVMITGDHPITARAIARELGILRAGDDPDEVVHARATPEDKLQIVRRWKGRGAIVAMTGDGVNDAPALREAHVGIAMGRSGTEVTREASDMVLSDDNFASIVAAVREGRGIYDNIRKTLVYLLAGNTGELLVMFGAAVAGWPLPLMPLHLLWINLATDGLPALALVMDPPEEDILRRPPRPPSEPILGRAEWLNVAWTGVLQAAVVLGVFVWGLRSGDVADARSLAFTTLVFGELFRSFASRSRTRLFWEVGAFTNLRLLAVIVASALIQVALPQVPALARLFQIPALSPLEIATSFGLGLVPVTVLELTKLVRRAFRAPARDPRP
ncbi:MAG TPA: cation-translocating P-type ATPase [Polyangia bacterium]